MNRVHLYGSLKEKYGNHHDFAIRNAPEAIKALNANFPGFNQDIRDGEFVVMRGDKKDGLSLDNETLRMDLGTNDLHIIPRVGGKGGDDTKTIITIVIGVALIASGYAPIGGEIVAEGGTAAAASSTSSNAILGGLLGMTNGQVVFLGATMALTGVASLIAPTPSFSAVEAADNTRSFIFSGPTNVTTEGAPVPLMYGRARVGSVTVQASIKVNSSPNVMVDAYRDTLSTHGGHWSQGTERRFEEL